MVQRPYRSSTYRNKELYPTDLYFTDLERAGYIDHPKGRGMIRDLKGINRFHAYMRGPWVKSIHVDLEKHGRHPRADDLRGQEIMHRLRILYKEISRIRRMREIHRSTL